MAPNDRSCLEAVRHTTEGIIQVTQRHVVRTVGSILVHRVDEHVSGSNAGHKGGRPHLPVGLGVGVSATRVRQAGVDWEKCWFGSPSI